MILAVVFAVTFDALEAFEETLAEVLAAISAVALAEMFAVALEELLATT